MTKYHTIRQEMIDTCRKMNATGLNVGTSGNLSVRIENGFLITPTGIDYDTLKPDQIVEMDMTGRYYGDFVPSSEWRFHYDILRQRTDVNVVLHSHSVNCAILACCRLDIPPIHYMIGVSGGSEIKCSGYAPFGTQELSRAALEALGPRMACLLGNHGVIALGNTPDKAFNVLQEVENLARIYIGTRLLGSGVTLTENDMSVVLRRFQSYGKQLSEIDPSWPDLVEPPVYGGPVRSDP